MLFKLMWLMVVVLVCIILLLYMNYIVFDLLVVVVDEDYSDVLCELVWLFDLVLKVVVVGYDSLL